jgi:RNA polymerase sigma-70 factor (ECF subfamily)
MALVGGQSNSEVFEELLMPLFDSLFNFAQWLTHDRTEAEDLVQETCVKALKGFSSFRMGTNFRAWIFRILRNTFLTSRTRLRNLTTVSLDEDEAPENLVLTRQNPESILLSNIDQADLQSAIEQLNLPLREVLLLCDVEEMSYQETADTLGIPIGTVMSRLSRARQSMRQMLTPGQERKKSVGRQA